jgi:hypothetical protein
MTSVPVALQQQVARWADAWLATTFSRLLELRARDPGPFNDYRSLTAAECFKEIEENEIFWPTT